MSDLKCPRCGTTKYRNPSLKLLVNVCGHGLCENCVEALFVKGSGSCPKCNTVLRRHNFRLQLFEDDFVEKEVDIRRKILKDFNKKEDDFDTMNEYNDYLEEIENIIYNLSNNIDVEETKKKIENYKRENASIIQKNKGKLSKDEELIEQLLEQEKEEETIRKQIITEEEKIANKIKSKLQKDLVEELMFSDLPADQILASHASNKQDVLSPITMNINKSFQQQKQESKTTTFSTGIKVGKGSSQFEPIPKSDEGVLFIYTEPNQYLNGPVCPDISSLERSTYLMNVRSPSPSEKAGGYKSEYACLRALQESFCGLYYN